MATYNVYKIFRMGDKAGQKSIHPTTQVSAASLSAAKASFVHHPKYKSKIEYAFEFVSMDDLVEEISASTTSTNLVEENSQTKKVKNDVNSCKVGDIVWLKINQFAEDEPYVEGKIYEIKEQTETQPQKVYTIWITGDFASWRWRKADQILTKRPRQSREILAKLKTSAQEDEENAV